MQRLPVKEFKYFLVNKIKRSLNILHDKVAFAFNFSCPEPGFIEASPESYSQVNLSKNQEDKFNKQQEQTNNRPVKKCSLCEYLPVSAVKCLDCDSFYCGKCALMLNFLWDSLLNTKESYKTCSSYSADDLFGHEFLCVTCKELHVGKIITNLTESEASFTLFNRKVHCNKFGCDVKDDYSTVVAHYGTCSSEPGFKIEPDRLKALDNQRDNSWTSLPVEEQQTFKQRNHPQRIHLNPRNEQTGKWQRKPTYFKHRKHWRMHRNTPRFSIDPFPSEMFRE